MPVYTSGPFLTLFPLIPFPCFGSSIPPTNAIQSTQTQINCVFSGSTGYLLSVPAVLRSSLRVPTSLRRTALSSRSIHFVWEVYEGMGRWVTSQAWPVRSLLHPWPLLFVQGQARIPSLTNQSLCLCLAIVIGSQMDT